MSLDAPDDAVVAVAGAGDVSPTPNVPRAGLPAGVVTRGMAYVIDLFTATVVFSASVAGTRFLVDLLTAGQVDLADAPTGVLGLGWGLWWIVYFSASTAYAGRTPGKALLGLRVLRRGGAPVGVVRAAIRSIAVPVLLGATFGIDALFAAVSVRRRALHDLATGTTVIYDWPARPGERRLRIIDGRNPPTPAPPAS